METGIPLRILYLEDQSADAQRVQETLTAEGLACDIVRVETHADFAAALDQDGWDLIFADNDLARFDGLSALALARGRRPAVPFIFLSETRGEELAIESLKNGATDYVLKQRLDRLASVTRRALQDAAARREQKEAEDAQRESAAQVRMLLDSTAEGIYGLDLAGRCTFSNAACARLLGYSDPGVLLGKNMHALIHHTKADGAPYPDEECGISQAFRQGADTHADTEVLWRADGTSFCAEYWSHLIRREGQVIGSVVTFLDITERKRAEEQTQRHLRSLAALRSIDLVISATLDLRVTLKALLEQVRSQLRVDAAAVLLLNPYTQMLEFAAGRGFRTKDLQRMRLPVGEGLAGRVALERQVIAVSGLQDDDPALVRATLLADEQFTAYCGAPLMAKGQNRGVLEIFHRAPLDPDEDWLEFFEALAGQAAIAIELAQLFDDLQRSNTELILAYNTTIEGWSRALDLRDRETEGHSLRVTELTVRLARAMGIGQAELIHIRRGALLHDIGKMGVPDAILLKPGPLTEEEWGIMRRHPTNAYELLTPIAYLRPALDIPYAHHEKWDGSGYPRGLKGEQIPLAARIFTVVDVWDALRSDRPYRPAWAEEQTRQYLRDQAGRSFDPQIVAVFLDPAFASFQEEIEGMGRPGV
jgi:PAS domain S-box-containing protein/putative nucleotidyltransferase with HDIG domain